MVFAAADPERDHLRLLANVNWLEQAQLKPGDRFPWPGTWTYSENKMQAGDHSNTQYALLGLNAASEAGIAVNPRVWALSRTTSSATRTTTAAGPTRRCTTPRPAA